MLKQVKLKECDSTQVVAKELLGKGESTPFLVSTISQTGGVGRRGNQWTKPKNSIAFSLITSPHHVLSLSSLEFGLLLIKYFSEKFTSKIQLKWPNDLILDEKKVGGIICHLSEDKLIVGVGINLGPFELDFETNSIFEPGYISEELILNEEQYHSIPYEICQYLNQNRNLKVDKLIDQWNEACFHLGKKVEISDGEVSFEGSFLGIGEHGEALLEIGDETIKVYTGNLRIL